MSTTVNPTRFFGLGGMQEIGKSTLVIEDDNDIVIIDAGIKFANLFSTGIKGMVPNYQYLQENQAKIRGLFITHGHEDHIGGIIYLVQEVDIKKIFAPKIAIEYLKAKFEDQKIKPKVQFVEIVKDEIHCFNTLTVDFWTAQHSIPDAFGVRVTSKHGSIMCTGDFRFDYTPIGNYTDFERLKQIGKQNLTVLFSDSTNAMRPNHSPSERDILADIEMHMRAATRKIIITAFASNLTRIKALIEIGIKLEKKILVFGRSMVNGINIGRRSGYINVPDDVFLGKNLTGIDENQMLILTTGSQGEQLAALDRMSNKKHPKINIEPRDMIIFSSSPIPGNKIKIEHLINRLYKLQAIIKENGPDGYLHTSGHAYKAEHEKIFQLTKPKYFFPYHGEYRMCVSHAQTAIESGINTKNIFIPENGQVFEMIDEEIYQTNKKIPCEPIYIDGETISRDNSKIINDRQSLRENGFVFVLIPVDKAKNLIAGRISIVTKGVFTLRTGNQIIAEIRRLVFSSIKYYFLNRQKWSPPQIKQLVKNRLSSYFYRTKRWKPVILSKIVCVDQKVDFIIEHQEKFGEKNQSRITQKNENESNFQEKNLEKIAIFSKNSDRIEVKNSFETGTKFFAKKIKGEKQDQFSKPNLVKSEQNSPNYIQKTRKNLDSLQKNFEYKNKNQRKMQEKRVNFQSINPKNFGNNLVKTQKTDFSNSFYSKRQIKISENLQKMELQNKNLEKEYRPKQDSRILKNPRKTYQNRPNFAQNEQKNSQERKTNFDKKTNK
ncbi:ribonuclease J [Mycoplasma sp. 'Moose RK']|uniref:ribonuclease J n=1 Tax=Mycoplasma sp. 'Moose RK' TaxID=2780095 RepID=UPI0018C2C5B0|nr:ribonuclease J [Mycoplasma sp. 'Moose RK']MBG0730915.1 ribonuclease J [Mycoplasma sp. 'Moose RK']